MQVVSKRGWLVFGERLVGNFKLCFWEGEGSDAMREECQNNCVLRRELDPFVDLLTANDRQYALLWNTEAKDGHGKAKVPIRHKVPSKFLRGFIARKRIATGCAPEAEVPPGNNPSTSPDGSYRQAFQPLVAAWRPWGFPAISTSRLFHDRIATPIGG